MIYRIILQNFRSFKDRVELSLIPDADSIHVAYDDTKYPTLRSAAIYGANASGKSNIIKAIDFLRDVILDNSIIPVVKNQAFRLDATSVVSPSLMVVEIRLDNYIYQYGVVFNFSTSCIIKEWLKSYNVDLDNWSPIFIRTLNNNINEIEFITSNDNPNQVRYEIYKEDLAKQSQRLVLSEIASKGLSDSDCAEHINRIYEWFNDLSIIFPSTSYNLLGALAKDEQAVNELYKSYFNVFDIDIEEIKLKQVPSDLIHIPDKLVTQIKKDLQAQKNNKKFAMIHGNRDFLARMDNRGELAFLEVSFVHKLNNYQGDFEIQEESDGTQRLFDLIPMIGYLMHSNKVVMIDEIDRSLHCLLTRKLLQMVLNESEATKSQIVLTTHDVLLMDLSILGKREIWFVDKKSKVSSLYPLDKFRIDSKIDINKNYLLGRFKAIPEY